MFPNVRRLPDAYGNTQTQVHSVKQAAPRNNRPEYAAQVTFAWNVQFRREEEGLGGSTELFITISEGHAKLRY